MPSHVAQGRHRGMPATLRPRHLLTSRRFCTFNGTVTEQSSTHSTRHQENSRHLGLFVGTTAHRLIPACTTLQLQKQLQAQFTSRRTIRCRMKPSVFTRLVPHQQLARVVPLVIVTTQSLGPRKPKLWLIGGTVATKAPTRMAPWQAFLHPD